MQRSSNHSKSSSSSSQITIASSPSSSYQLNGFFDTESHGGGSFNFGGEGGEGLGRHREAAWRSRRAAIPDHSPFTPHPALQLGSDEVTAATMASGKSPVMPHYKKENGGLSTSTATTRTTTSFNEVRDGESGLAQEAFLALRGGAAPRKKYFSSAEEKEEALLLEYYWSHYWHRSLS